MFLRLQIATVFGNKKGRELHVEHVFTSSYKKAINQILSEMFFQSKNKRKEIFSYLFKISFLFHFKIALFYV